MAEVFSSRLHCDAVTIKHPLQYMYLHFNPTTIEQPCTFSNTTLHNTIMTKWILHNNWTWKKKKKMKKKTKSAKSAYLTKLHSCSCQRCVGKFKAWFGGFVLLVSLHYNQVHHRWKVLLSKRKSRRDALRWTWRRTPVSTSGVDTSVSDRLRFVRFVLKEALVNAAKTLQHWSRGFEKKCCSCLVNLESGFPCHNGKETVNSNHGKTLILILILITVTVADHQRLPRLQAAWHLDCQADRLRRWLVNSGKKLFPPLDKMTNRPRPTLTQQPVSKIKP